MNAAGTECSDLTAASDIYAAIDALMRLHFRFERIGDYVYSTMSNMNSSSRDIGCSYLAYKKGVKRGLVDCNEKWRRRRAGCRACMYNFLLNLLTWRRVQGTEVLAAVDRKA